MHISFFLFPWFPQKLGLGLELGIIWHDCQKMGQIIPKKMLPSFRKNFFSFFYIWFFIIVGKKEKFLIIFWSIFVIRFYVTLLKRVQE